MSRSNNVKRLQNKEDKKKLEEQMRERDRKRKLVKEILFPILYEHSKSIEDAKIFCTIITSSIRQACNAVVMRKILSEIDLTKELNTDAADFKRFKKVFDSLGGENIATVLELVDGAAHLIEGSQREEGAKRKLKELAISLL